MTAAYVYGIVPADATVPDGLAGIGGRPCRATGPCAAVAAVISALPASRALGTPADLRAHAAVVDALAQSGAVLPLRFGGVLEDEDAVRAELLEPYQEEFAGRLAFLGGCDQFTVRGRYEGDVALREIVAEEPEVRSLREQLRGRDEVAGRAGNLRLGELVASALERKREADAAVLAEALTPHAAAVADRPPGTAATAADMAFLVSRPRQRGFESAARELGRRWAGRIRLRLVGPQAPYDFTQ
ncbi:MAG TPA: GvpL/GvpF family gas vesicle protein [Streptosporangiaceae bacterium]|nr:GvpL/GvpF family gas vesicle protein [Streptosporangiaceae bacterium]